MHRFIVCGLLLAVAIASWVGAASAAGTPSNAELIARGKYLVTFGACNDCHTPGWRESFGNVPVSNWMVGTTTGFRGPWGTVYAANVRLRFFEITEDQWLSMVNTREGHPPMTWHDIRELSTQDRRAIYRFIRSLGKAGSPSLASLPPQQEPKTPYFTLVRPK